MTEFAIIRFVCAVLARRAKTDPDLSWFWHARLKAAKFHLACLKRTVPDWPTIPVLTPDQCREVLQNDPHLQFPGPKPVSMAAARWRRDLQSRVRTVLDRWWERQSR